MMIFVYDAQDLNPIYTQNDLVAYHAKLNWATPLIFEMLANKTHGKQSFYRKTTFFFPVGPSSLMNQSPQIM